MQYAQNTLLKTSTGFAIIHLKIPNSKETLEFKFIVVDEISRLLPTQKIDLLTNNPEFIQLPLADPNYGLPTHIDALFVMNIWIKILSNGLIKTADGNSAAQKTLFGWVLYSCDKHARILEKRKIFHTTISEPTHLELSELLQRFWKIEDLPKTVHLSPEERQWNASLSKVILDDRMVDMWCTIPSMTK